MAYSLNHLFHYLQDGEVYGGYITDVEKDTGNLFIVTEKGDEEGFYIPVKDVVEFKDMEKEEIREFEFHLKSETPSPSNSFLSVRPDYLRDYLMMKEDFGKDDHTVKSYRAFLNLLDFTISLLGTSREAFLDAPKTRAICGCCGYLDEGKKDVCYKCGADMWLEKADFTDRGLAEHVAMCTGVIRSVWRVSNMDIYNKFE